MQIGAGGVDLAHAAFDRGARVGQLLGHGRERAREATQFIVALQDGLGAQIAGGDFAHAVGKQQQWPHQLIAEQHRQQHGTKHRQKQTQRERADVHAAQSATGQRAFLVLAVGLLHGDGVGHE